MIITIKEYNTISICNQTKIESKDTNECNCKENCGCLTGGTCLCHEGRCKCNEKCKCTTMKVKCVNE